ncbi:MAG: hypothetical protein K2N05_03285 [Muribaculaceae bacterium]|nr:hypothetical protein [Muribaculaceae bacterium]
MAKKKKKSKGSASKPISDKRFIMEKARSLPIYRCYVTEDWEKTGMAQVIIARERANGNLCVGMYLCDTWCLGVKDAYGMVNITKEEFEREVIDPNPYLKECDYVYAHNLVYGAEAFAADAAIDPHPDFSLWGHILEEDTDDIPLIEMEFGDEGKYHLVAPKGSKEALYAPGLKERLGEDFICNIGYREGILNDEESDDDMDYYDEYDYEDEEEERAYSEFERIMSENAPKSMEELLQRMTDGFKKTQDEDQRHPDELYSYQHPSYPAKLEIKHKFIAEEFKKPSNSLDLPTKIIDRILDIPKEEVVDDLSKIIMYTIGKTWKAIDEDTLEWTNDDTIIHSLLFLSQIGDPAGLDAVMEVMRQDNAFREFHMGDSDTMILPNALYLTGRTRTDILEEFLMHPGFEGYAKEFVSDALSYIAIVEPERRPEIIEIYRRYLNFMQENIPSQNGCSGYVAGVIIGNLIDIKAIELLPEIKRLHDSGYVNLNLCGPYEEVEKEIKSPKKPLSKFDFKDIKDMYKSLKRTFKD